MKEDIKLKIKQPIISIIVPVYNAELFLANTLESILNQTFKNFELILINDGSTDNSLDICRKYESFDKRIIVIDQQNKGVCVARNSGLDIAKGEYISFADNDDILHPQMLEILYSNIRNDDYDISMCFTETPSFENLSKYKTHKLPIENRAITNTEMIRRLFSTCNVDFHYMCIWNKIYKKEIFNNERFPNMNPEDLAIIYKLYLKTNKINLCDLKLYNWIQHEKSHSHQKFGKRDIDIIKTYYFIYKDLCHKKKKKEAYFCLVKLYKIILHKKNNSKGTFWYRKVNSYSNMIIKRTLKDFINVIKLDKAQNLAILSFILIPGLYSLYIKYQEFKQ